MVCINKTMNTDKQNFQKWLSSNGNLTHAIHVTPNKYSDTQMRKYFRWVNFELNKTFLPRRFYNFKNQFDRFMFIGFREFQHTDKGRHYHLLVHTPDSVTKHYRGGCFCSRKDAKQINPKPCEYCIEFCLRDIFEELKANIKTTIRNTLEDSEYEGSQQVYVSKQLPTRFTGDYKHDNLFIVTG